jgi:hypothetical protein
VTLAVDADAAAPKTAIVAATNDARAIPILSISAPHSARRDIDRK